MKKLLSIVYTVYCAIIFVAVFLLLFPLIYICIQRKSWHRFAHRIIRFWSYCFFFLVGMPIKREFRFRPVRSATYVFVANHFTYLDIAVGMNILDNYFAYVGKSDVKNVPLFGYMFAKLHIQVDRTDKNSRTKSLKKGIDTVKSGRSVFIMPEGGIITENPPYMHTPFKDGPFLMAIENQVPIVPITYLNLHKINEPLNLFKWGRPKVIFHEPIITLGMTSEDINALKRQVYEVIQGELNTHWKLPNIPYYEEDTRNKKYR